MDHACSKCGSSVEDGIPFCPSCGQPQIRVLVPNAASAATVPMPPGTPDDIQPPSEPLSADLGRVDRPRSPLGWASDPTGEMREAIAVRQNMRRAALIAGVLAGFGCGPAHVLPLILLVMVVGGGIAVTIFHRRMPSATVTPSMGFKIGLLAGFFAWLTNALFNALQMASSTTRALLRKELNDKLAEAISNAPDQATKEAFQRVGEMISSPSGLVGLVAFALVFLGVIFLIFGGVGGAIGATLFGRQPHRD